MAFRRVSLKNWPRDKRGKLLPRRRWPRKNPSRGTKRMRRGRGRMRRNPFVTIAANPSGSGGMTQLGLTGVPPRMTLTKLIAATSAAAQKKRTKRKTKRKGSTMKRKRRRKMSRKAALRRARAAQRKRWRRVPMLRDRKRRRKGFPRRYRIFKGRRFRMYRRNPFGTVQIWKILRAGAFGVAGYCTARLVAMGYNKYIAPKVVGTATDPKSFRVIAANLLRIAAMETGVIVVGKYGVAKFAKPEDAAAFYIGGTTEAVRTAIGTAIKTFKPDFDAAKYGLGAAGSGQYSQYVQGPDGRVYGLAGRQWYLVAKPQGMAGLEARDDFAGLEDRDDFAGIEEEWEGQAEDEAA